VVKEKAKEAKEAEEKEESGRGGTGGGAKVGDEKGKEAQDGGEARKMYLLGLSDLDLCRAVTTGGEAKMLLTRLVSNQFTGIPDAVVAVMTESLRKGRTFFFKICLTAKMVEKMHEVVVSGDVQTTPAIVELLHSLRYVYTDPAATGGGDVRGGVAVGDGGIGRPDDHSIASSSASSSSSSSSAAVSAPSATPAFSSTASRYGDEDYTPWKRGRYRCDKCGDYKVTDEGLSHHCARENDDAECVRVDVEGHDLVVPAHATVVWLLWHVLQKMGRNVFRRNAILYRVNLVM
jgi:hypothetical protein